MTIEIPESILAIGYDKNLWITVHDFVFYIDSRKFIIPKGFVLDFYSIPWFLHWWRPNRPGFGEEAAASHDFLRRFNKDFDMSIKYTDKVFYAVMDYYKLSTKRIKYIAVRMFAWATDDGGEGKPSKKVRVAMSKKKNSWQEYREIVLDINGLD